jgi:cytochrome b561
MSASPTSPRVRHGRSHADMHRKHVGGVSRHSPATIALHWGSALALVLCAAAGIARDWTDNDAWRVLLLDVHRQLGLLVLLALGLRLAVRWRVGMADHATGLSRPMKLAAHLAHLGLYALLLALPLLGLATSQAHAVKVRLLGLWQLPTLVAADPDLADTLSDWHLWAAWLLLALVVMHVLAAWWHHAHRRDGVLAAMLPLVKPRPHD